MGCTEEQGAIDMRRILVVYACLMCLGGVWAQSIETVKLTNDRCSGLGRFSPDGSQVAFLTAPPRESPRIMHLCLWQAGKTRVLATFPYAEVLWEGGEEWGGPAWVGGSKYLLQLTVGGDGKSIWFRGEYEATGILVRLSDGAV